VGSTRAWCDGRRQRRFIGNGLGAKANDRLVARRQTRKGMQWSIVCCPHVRWHESCYSTRRVIGFMVYPRLRAGGGPMIEKHSRVAEEVRLRKDTVTEQQRVSDMVRKERGSVEGADMAGQADGVARESAHPLARCGTKPSIHKERERRDD
jgi:hypothetical protein